MPAPDDSPSDESLLARYRSGDGAAFEALYARHRQGLYRFLVSLSNKAELAEEIYQETWLSLIRSATQPQGRASFRTWLFQIGRNAAFDLLRRQQRIDFVSYDAGNPADEPGDPAPSPEQQCADRQRLRLLERALAALPAEQREILLLRELEDMSYAELAVTLGINEGTVKSRLARARAAALLHYRDYTGAHRDE